MGQILLTDEEMDRIDIHYTFVNCGITHANRVKAKAQLKKVKDRLSKWAQEMCPHTNRGSFKYGCIECWLALLKEVERP